MVRQRCLAGAEGKPPTHEPRVAHRVVGRPEGPLGHQSRSRREEARHRVHPCHLQGLGQGERWQNPREAASQHGLSRAGGAQQEEVVPSRRSHLQGPLRAFLPSDVQEIRSRGGRQAELGRRVHLPRRKQGVSSQVGHHFGQGACPVHQHPLHHRGLGCILPGHNHGADTGAGALGRQREHAPHRTECPVQPQLADEGCALQPSRVHVPRGSQEAHGQREVEGTPLLAHVGRRQVDRDPPGRKREAGVAQRGAHPFASLADRALRQPHHGERREPRRQVDLHPDQIRVDAADGARGDMGQHGKTLAPRPVPANAPLGRRARPARAPPGPPPAEAPTPAPREPRSSSRSRRRGAAPRAPGGACG